MNRELWLSTLAHRLTARVEEGAGKPMPIHRISVGFPSRGALSQRRRVIGQCWSGLVSSTGHSELFISPMLGDPLEVAATTAHEMLHAAVGVKEGHRKPFSRAAKAIGLEGKPTSTYAGSAFIEYVKPILSDLGPYPHAPLTIASGYSKQATNMLKVECKECGYVLRTTAKWLDRAGPPLCPCNCLPMSQS